MVVAGMIDVRASRSFRQFKRRGKLLPRRVWFSGRGLSRALLRA